MFLRILNQIFLIRLNWWWPINVTLLIFHQVDNFLFKWTVVFTLALADILFLFASEIFRFWGWSIWMSRTYLWVQFGLFAIYDLVNHSFFIDVAWTSTQLASSGRSLICKEILLLTIFGNRFELSTFVVRFFIRVKSSRLDFVGINA